MGRGEFRFIFAHGNMRANAVQVPLRNFVSDGWNFGAASTVPLLHVRLVSGLCTRDISASIELKIFL
jgi:hypothetical protein